MINKRRKRSLNRSIRHYRDTNIVFIGIEGGDGKVSREARYFDIFKEQNVRFQFKVIPCDNNRSSQDPGNSDGYSAIFYDKAKKAIERARNKDNSNERWPNENGSRVYKIIDRFFEE